MAKILIVEDDKIIAREMKKYMENWGYEAATIQNFKEILSEFAAFSPQLVLMDISLPVDITGVKRSDRFQRFPLFLSLLPPII